MAKFRHRIRFWGNCFSLFILLWALVLTASCSTTPEISVPTYDYEIVNIYPHDSEAFTQGLVFEDGFIYEGTGLYGESSIRKVELHSGNVVQARDLPEQYFGEGIALVNDSLIQLTWKSNTGFIYDKSTFVLTGSFAYPTEGWGLTYDGERLIMSDGTSTLRFLDPETFTIADAIDVHDNDKPVDKLNELEYIDGWIYANVWLTDKIAIINPQNGQVTGWLDLSGLADSQESSATIDVANGIAYDAQEDRLFVTGKLWPWLFEIELRPRK
jgi:glutamine cyclotransferase